MINTIAKFIQLRIIRFILLFIPAIITILSAIMIFISCCDSHKNILIYTYLISGFFTIINSIFVYSMDMIYGTKIKLNEK